MPVTLEIYPMKPTRHNSASIATPSTGLRSTAVHSAMWLLGPLAIAVPLFLVLAFGRAGADATGTAVLWAVATNFV